MGSSVGFSGIGTFQGLFAAKGTGGAEAEVVAAVCVLVVVLVVPLVVLLEALVDEVLVDERLVLVLVCVLELDFELTVQLVVVREEEEMEVVVLEGVAVLEEIVELVVVLSDVDGTDVVLTVVVVAVELLVRVDDRDEEVVVEVKDSRPSLWPLRRRPRLADERAARSERDLRRAWRTRELRPREFCLYGLAPVTATPVAALRPSATSAETAASRVSEIDIRAFLEEDSACERRRTPLSGATPVRLRPHRRAAISPERTGHAVDGCPRARVDERRSRRGRR